MLNGIILKPEMSCEYICSVIQKIINKYASENGSTNDCILSLEIRRIIDSPETSGPLALPLKEE